MYTSDGCIEKIVMKWNRFNEMIAVFVCFLAVPLVCATPIILWEDFDDGSGIGAFDSSFVHTIGPHPERGTGELDWELMGKASGIPFSMLASIRGVG